MKKFIKHNDKYIELIHYKPFDKKEGLGKTEEELLQIGALVDEIVEPENKEGFFAKPFYDKKTNTVYFEYLELPKTYEIH